MYLDLRRESAERLCELGFPGYAIGGLSVGEPREQTREVIEATLPHLPADKPRYVMLTLIDSPRKVHWASLTAAPLFGRVAGETLRQMAVTPTEPLTKPKPKPKTTHETL